MKSNPQNTFYDAKRMLGKQITDPLIQDLLKVWSFNVIAENGCPVYQLIRKNVSEERISPVQISALVLEKIKDAAKDKLINQFTENKCVVTVPAYFNDE